MSKIQKNDQQLSLGMQAAADIYVQLQQDLFDRMIKRLKVRGNADLVDNPYIWQLEKLNDMHLLNEANVKLIAERAGIAESILRDVIQNEGLKIYQDTKQQLEEDLNRPASATVRNGVTESLEAYTRQAVDDLNLINSTLPASIRSVFQSIVTQTVAEVVTGTKTADRALHDTIMSWQKKNFTGFVDKAGREWRADVYARAVIKTTTYKVYNEMRIQPAEEMGVDTYYYSKKLTARPACSPLQGQIVTFGASREVGGETVYSLYDYGYGTAGGCLGIHCGHYLIPFIIGVNTKPDEPEHLKNLTPEQAEENARIEAKQRVLERTIRNAKERLHVAKQLGDDDLITVERLKVRMYQGKMRALVDNYSFLHRDYRREKLYENPASLVRTEVKVKHDLARLEKHRSEQKEMREKFSKSLKNDIIKTEINNEHFERHIRGTKEYENYFNQNMARGKQPPSYLTITKEECQALVDRYAGTGQFKYNPKAERMQEIISQSKPIGTYIDSKTGEVIEKATDFRIHYSKTGSHIVPTIKGRRL